MTHVYILMYSASEWRFLDLWCFINIIIIIIILMMENQWCRLTTAAFVRLVSTVDASVAAVREGYTDWRVVTLELTVHTRVGGTIDLIRPIAALMHAVADARRWDTVEAGRGVGALEQSWLVAVVLLTRRWFICVVPAVVLAVTAPPERNALVRLLTQELGTETGHNGLNLSLGRIFKTKQKVTC